MHHITLTVYISPCYAAPQSHESRTHLRGTVRQFKQRLAKELALPHLEKSHLVWGGCVLLDKTLMSNCGLFSSAKICLVAPSIPIKHMRKDCLRIIQDLQYHHDPNTNQNNPESLVSVLEPFSNDITLADAPWKPSKKDIKLLKWALKALANTLPTIATPAVKWFGRYGCALIAWLTPYQQVSLSLICLDKWSFYIHSCSSSRPNSVPDDHEFKLFFVGSVSLSAYEQFLTSVAHKFVEVKERRGNERTSAAGKQGHHKTPGMVHAIMREVLKNSKAAAVIPKGKQVPENSKVVIPKGGFTDVGLHTGGQPRNTSRHLVVAMLHRLLDSKSANELFRTVLIQLPLRMAEHTVATILSEIERPTSNLRDDPGRWRELTDSVMQTLRHAAEEFEAFAKLYTGTLSSESTLYEARCIRTRHELELLVEKRMKYVSDHYVLPSLSSVSFKGLSLIIPPESEVRSQPQPITRENLRLFPASPHIDCSWEDMKKWIFHFYPSCHGVDNTVMQHAICKTIERFFFSKMTSMRYVSPTIVEEIMDKYRIISRRLQQCAESRGALRTELMSKELLVVWISFCHVHFAAKKVHPLVGEYAVPLQPNNLQFLLLSEKAAANAARYVTIYLCDNSKGQGPIFSCLISDMTMEFAMRHGNNRKAVTKAWEQEEQKMKTRESRRWAEILRKQERLVQLDREVENLEKKRQKVILGRTESPLLIALKRLISWLLSLVVRPPQRQERLENRRTEDANLGQQLSAKFSEIRTLEKAPAPILQPWPSDHNLSITRLALLCLPGDLNILSRLSFVAQQMLIPDETKISLMAPTCDESTVDIDEAISTVQPRKVWRPFYAKGVLLGSSNSIPSGNSWYSSNVRHISSSSDGVWYPDALEPKLFWKGGNDPLDSRTSKLFFNPFRRISPLIIMHKFTEDFRMATSVSSKNSLQWALFQRRVNASSDRGNYELSFQTEKPDMLGSNDAFLDLRGLHYIVPLLQIRKLCSILLYRSLPLIEVQVRYMINHAMQQLGELSEDKAVERVWHTDLDKFDGWAALRGTLEALCEELRCKFREDGSIATIGEFAVHASQWDTGCRRVARNLASIAEKAADDLVQDELKSRYEDASVIRARRCILYMSCLLCHSAGELSLDDVTQICKALVMADYMRRFKDPTSFDAEIRNKTTATMRVMASRMPQVVAMIRQNPQIFSNAVRSMHEAAEIDLSTIAYVNLSTTIVARSAGGQLYHMNLQTGAVLFDGRPPSRLSKSIRSSRLYKRSFQTRNFEVVTDGDGRATTTRAFGGCFYEFTKTDGGVIIKEINGSDQTSALHLLDDTTIDSWGKDIPERLKKEYSHWVCRKTNTILLRPKNFRKRDVYFVLTQQPPGMVVGKSDAATGVPDSDLDRGTEWWCFRVPPHLREQNWHGLSQDCSNLPRLVDLTDRTSKRVLDILRKFDRSKESIQCVLEPSGSFLINFPRFGIDFQTTEEGGLKSSLFSSFKLCESQNFDDTLMDFSGYLVLESEGMKKVLIPSGHVCKESGTVSVSFSEPPSFHVYDIHPRFGTLESASEDDSGEARLQLAALYTATGTLLPEKRLGKTGGEHAIELLRQSCKKSPMSTSETKHLKSICSFGQLYPSLSLLAYKVFFSSQMPNTLSFEGTGNDCGISLNIEATTEYVLQKNKLQLNPRVLLTSDEERHVHGSPIATGKHMRSRNIGNHDTCIVSTEDVKTEAEGQKMIQGCLARCTDSQKVLLNRIRVSLGTIQGDSAENACFNVRRAANMEAQMTKEDLQNIWNATRDGTIVSTDFLNPFLKPESSERVRFLISEWMKLCDLEGKLSQMLRENKLKDTA